MVHVTCLHSAIKRIRRAGFTLLEVTVALGLAGVLGAVMVPTFYTYRAQNDLSVTVSQVVQALGSARIFSQSNKHDSPWGFHVGEGVLFQGSSFASRNTSADVFFPLPDTVTASGLREAVFSQISGRVVQGGVILLTARNGDQVAITIDADGLEVVSVTQEIIDIAHSFDASTPPPVVSSSPNSGSQSSVGEDGASSSAVTASSVAPVASSTASITITSVSSSSNSVTSLFSSVTSADTSLSAGAASSVPGDTGGASSEGGVNSATASDSSVYGATSSDVPPASSGEESSSSASSTPMTPLVWQNQSVGILLLDPTSQGALMLTGNGKMKITNANATVMVNSDHSAAVVMSGNGSISATTFNITGDPGVQKSGNAKIIGTVLTGISPTADPLADIPALAPPTQTFSNAKVSGNASVTLNPGTYIGGISVSANARVTLNPGIYYLQGGGLSLSGNATVTGNGVMIYNAPAKATDRISISGNANLTVSPITSGIYAGISMFQSRGSDVNMRISGNGTLNMDGVLYMPSALLDIPGNGNVNLQCLASSRFILRRLSFSGNGTFNVQ